MNVEIPDSADESEAAAIAAVFETLAAERAAAAAAAASDRPEELDRWRFTARIEGLQSRRVRAPVGAPADEWSAAGRTDRF